MRRRDERCLTFVTFAGVRPAPNALLRENRSASEASASGQIGWRTKGDLTGLRGSEVAFGRFRVWLFPRLLRIFSFNTFFMIPDARVASDPLVGPAGDGVTESAFCGALYDPKSLPTRWQALCWISTTAVADEGAIRQFPGT